MRLGIITGEYPPMDGGVGAYTQILAYEMSRMGHQIEILTRQISGETENNSNVTVRKAIKGKWGWRSTEEIARWTAKYAPDAVIIQFQTAAYDMHPAIHWVPSALRRQSVPSIVTFHDLRVPYLFPKAGRVRRWIVNKLAHDADGVICTDSEDFDILKADKRVRRLVRIPIGSNISPRDTNQTMRDEVRRELSIRPSQLLVGYFGFVSQSKGVGVLLDALARLIASGLDAHLVMIGGHAAEVDNQMSAYQSEVMEDIRHKYLDQRVHWTGFAPESQIGNWLSGCDIIALPFLDGVSLRSGTLMAALAHGKAIVTTAPRVDIPELEHAMEYAKPADAEDLANKIGTLWHEVARRKDFEQRAAEVSKRYFSWDEIARRTIAFCQEICSVELANHT